MENASIWQIWAENLHRWHLHSFAIWFLDSFSPVHLVGAQFVFISQPLLETFIPNGQLKVLASILEQPTQAQAFANYLREAF